MDSTGLSLFDYKPVPQIHFSGSTYNAVFDCERLNAQQGRVYETMIDGKWRTLREIADETHDPEASVSARLRDFNNHEYLKQFFRMEHRRRGDAKRGIFEYLVTRIA